MCHTDTDQEGFERLKTIGKLLDDKIVLEGMSTIVLKTSVSDGKYYFLTQNNGKDTTKSPAGMFPTYAIENDLKYVDDKIRNYYEIGDFKSDEEMAAADEEHKNEEITKEKKKRRHTETEEKPKRSRREKKESVTPADDEILNIPEGTSEEVPFPAEEEEKPKRRTRRKRD